VSGLLDFIGGKVLVAFSLIVPLLYWLAIGRFGVFENEKERRGWNRSAIGGGALALMLLLATSPIGGP